MMILASAVLAGSLLATGAQARGGGGGGGGHGGGGMGGFGGAVGSMLIALFTGLVLQFTGSYVPMFVIAGSTYFTTLLIIHLLVPGLEAARMQTGEV